MFSYIVATIPPSVYWWVRTDPRVAHMAPNIYVSIEGDRPRVCPRE
jgi:hypothetical protein